MWIWVTVRDGSRESTMSVEEWIQRRGSEWGRAGQGGAGGGRGRVLVFPYSGINSSINISPTFLFFSLAWTLWPPPSPPSVSVPLGRTSSLPPAGGCHRVSYGRSGKYGFFVKSRKQTSKGCWVNNWKQLTGTLFPTTGKKSPVPLLLPYVLIKHSGLWNEPTTSEETLTAFHTRGPESAVYLSLKTYI